MNHFASSTYWKEYKSLPEAVQRLAVSCFERLKENPRHPSLHLKRVGRYRSLSVGLNYRDIAVPDGEDLVWFWIGTHGEYDRLIKR